MKKNFSRDLSIEVIAVSEKVMSFADAQKFAAEKGGRLPDQVEATDIGEFSGFSRLVVWLFSSQVVSRLALAGDSVAITVKQLNHQTTNPPNHQTTKQRFHP